MTRVTNFGIKRTYVQAGFNEPDDTPQPSGSNHASNTEPILTSGQNGPTSEPPAKKKRKRTPKSKRDGHAAERAAEEARARGEEPPAPAAQATAPVTTQDPNSELSKRQQYKKKRNLERRMKVQSATEARRLKRISQKNMNVTCFACREKGHSAKDCKNSEASASEPGAAAVGICYRCGSKKHSLSRCKKPADPADPYPYASCFVCNGKGHLASACPLNKAKGVYPNGGSCKLCGETSHLAKDCGVRQKVTDSSAPVLGTGREAGADEDDFLLLKQKSIDLDKDEKQANKKKEMLDIRQGALTGTVKAVGAVSKPKKVVVFK